MTIMVIMVYICTFFSRNFRFVVRANVRPDVLDRVILPRIEPKTHFVSRFSRAKSRKSTTLLPVFIRTVNRAVTVNTQHAKSSARNRPGRRSDS